MSTTKKILIVLLAIFIIIQFFRPEKNQSIAESPNDIFAHYQASENTKQLIHTSCYDCHSNNTVYPWYAEIQPVAWWLADHVNEGKSELNFSEFASYSPKKGDHKLEELVEMIKEEEMPLKSYTLIHGDARLSDVQRDELSKWAEEVRALIQPNIK
ncbi:MAG: heme-binding domain-containing protein [Daejeonella sp.]|uniref:heme-binding domain-containing protein n=1 Tax=Daejeonella sp. TaxID=2805397 RepID=UPI0027362B92|nr:heme-binding domain-containing protein [Daejeonella sp.]MDP3468110.1 heme-binding domain-containing protein [Daejeonella sp.]